MDNKSDISLRIKDLVNHFAEGKNTKFASLVGTSEANIRNYTDNGKLPKFDFIVKVCSVFEISYDWFILGIGNMKDKPTHNIIKSPETEYKAIPSNTGIPLIPIEAVAGLAKGDITVMEYEVTENYLVPEFNARGVKYLIRVSGSSMYPKYSNGDILACRPITDTTFFQWGKVYVLDTDQGALVKRLFEGKDDSSIECRSDNKEHYPSFKINKTSIRTVSIVVGVIRLD
jgi:phage repressor protein C with HTH and peptisase S24 domain